MRADRWLRYLTIATAVLILSGCCRDRVALRGDWSIGVDAASCANCPGTGCVSSERVSMESGFAAPPFRAVLPAETSSGRPPLGGGAVEATPHAKFHPVPTRPVFAPHAAHTAPPFRTGLPASVEAPRPPHHAPDGWPPHRR